MEPIIYILIALVAGGIIGWLLGIANKRAATDKASATMQRELNAVLLEKNTTQAKFDAHIEHSRFQIETNEKELESSRLAIAQLQEKLNAATMQLGEVSIGFENNSKQLAEKLLEAAEQRNSIKTLQEQLTALHQQLATETANNQSLREKLKTQQETIESLNQKFQTEFENIANRILDSKTEKFTELNKNNLKSILEPLGQNISEFKTKVDEVYQKESAQRFSLGERVKELAELNKKISEEAHNLTRALKSESKTQGGWGEMILENILERSGLVRGREYEMEFQLKDEQGNALRSASEDKKMRPDAVIRYPDNRHVIIDSKVSLNAFLRCVEAVDEVTRTEELKEHVRCLKKHIQSLSEKGYDDYNKALDFVMMFIPSEPAYIAALQADPDLWNYAYDKRILLLSPTNLITSLKLIVDLWKREYQNQHANEIAQRGAKLYDKFVGFIGNLEEVGDHLRKAQSKYDDAHKKLTTGNDNLVTQANKLKELGLKTKKDLPTEMVNQATRDDVLS